MYAHTHIYIYIYIFHSIYIYSQREIDNHILHHFFRYLEASLPFQGFLQNNVQTLCDTINRQTVHLYPIHTDEDIKRHADLVKEKGRNKAKFAQKTSSGNLF